MDYLLLIFTFFVVIILMNYIKNTKYKYKYLRMTGGIYVIPSDKIVPMRVIDIVDKNEIRDIIKLKLEVNRQYIERINLLKSLTKDEIKADRNYLMKLGQNKLYLNELKTLNNLLLSDELVKKYNRILEGDMSSKEIVKLYYKNGILINID
jgi:hypothetical protein